MKILETECKFLCKCELEIIDSSILIKLAISRLCMIVYWIMFSCRYLTQNLNWFNEQLGEETEDYILFDCPGILVFTINNCLE